MTIKTRSEARRERQQRDDADAALAEEPAVMHRCSRSVFGTDATTAGMVNVQHGAADAGDMTFVDAQGGKVFLQFKCVMDQARAVKKNLLARRTALLEEIARIDNAIAQLPGEQPSSSSGAFVRIFGSPATGVVGTHAYVPAAATGATGSYPESEAPPQLTITDTIIQIIASAGSEGLTAEQVRDRLDVMKKSVRMENLHSYLYRLHAKDRRLEAVGDKPRRRYIIRTPAPDKEADKTE